GDLSTPCRHSRAVVDPFRNNGSAPSRSAPAPVSRRASRRAAASRAAFPPRAGPPITSITTITTPPPPQCEPCAARKSWGAELGVGAETLPPPPPFPLRTASLQEAHAGP